ncbi:MAG: type 2 isopentenyl-diphosphate Delta-isomerase [Anaerolineae bacterium]|nr:MAG: type 2 isopentenyl-diphosphate Delta-isomerase [Anaerolineae bacterium]
MSKVTAERKADHIRVNLEQEVDSGLISGFESLRFEHNALPELDLAEIDLSQELLGKVLAAPLLISSMTGGTEQADEINRNLAMAAQSSGIAMGLGSQRVAIEDPSLADTFNVRALAPDVLLFANLGAVQLNYGYGADEAQRAIDMIEADALVLHLNPLQEAVQTEGDTNFRDLLSQIEAVVGSVTVPVIAKEVGWGISSSVATRLVEAGVAVIDVAGAGGTSWSQVEMHRATKQKQAELASRFVDWGIPTAEAVRQVRAALPGVPIIASGGLRGGLDLAKSIALGAQLGGMAGPFLRAAVESSQAVSDLIDQTLQELRVCMFATGSRDLNALPSAKFLSRP